MERIAPLLVIALIWLVVGRSAVRNVQKRGGRQAGRPVRPANAPEAPDAPEIPADTDAVPVESGPTRLTPTVFPTVHDDTIYQGSLNAVTGAGDDPSHAEDL